MGGLSGAQQVVGEVALARLGREQELEALVVGTLAPHAEVPVLTFGQLVHFPCQARHVLVLLVAAIERDGGVEDGVAREARDVLQAESAADARVVERLYGIDILLATVHLGHVEEVDVVVVGLHRVGIAAAQHCPLLVAHQSAVDIVVGHLRVGAGYPSHEDAAAADIGGVDMCHGGRHGRGTHDL